MEGDVYIMKELCDIKTVAEKLDVSVPYIRKLVYSKKIPHYKIGNRIRFDTKEINEWIEEYKQEERRSALYF